MIEKIRFWDFVFNRDLIRDYEALMEEQTSALIEFEEKTKLLLDEVGLLENRLSRLPVKLVERDEQRTDTT